MSASVLNIAQRNCVGQIGMKPFHQIYPIWRNKSKFSSKPNEMICDGYFVGHRNLIRIAPALNISWTIIFSKIVDRDIRLGTPSGYLFIQGFGVNLREQEILNNKARIAVRSHGNDPVQLNSLFTDLLS